MPIFNTIKTALQNNPGYDNLENHLNDDASDEALGYDTIKDKENLIYESITIEEPIYETIEENDSCKRMVEESMDESTPIETNHYMTYDPPYINTPYISMNATKNTACSSYFTNTLATKVRPNQETENTGEIRSKDSLEKQEKEIETLRKTIENADEKTKKIQLGELLILLEKKYYGGSENDIGACLTFEIASIKAQLKSKKPSSDTHQSLHFFHTIRETQPSLLTQDENLISPIKPTLS